MNRGFTKVDNTPLRDVHLSLRAMGLYSLICSKPPGWKFSVGGLASQCADGQKSVQAAIKELKNAGYLTVAKLNPSETSSGRYEYKYTLSAAAKQEHQNGGLETVGLKQGACVQAVEIQSVDNRLHSKNIKNSNLLNNNYNNIDSNDNAQIQAVFDSFNSICKSLPHAENLTTKLELQIRARLKTYGIERLREAFEKAEQSEFLTGEKGDWCASLEWLMRNDDNIDKVLSGAYEDYAVRETVASPDYSGTYITPTGDYAAIEAQFMAAYSH